MTFTQVMLQLVRHTYIVVPGNYNHKDNNEIFGQVKALYNHKRRASVQLYTVFEK